MSTIHPNPLLTSRTIEGLSEALSCAEQAIRQYEAAADCLDGARLQVIAHAFRFTAAQEGEHRAIFRGLLPAAAELASQPGQEEAAAEASPVHLLQQAIREEEACADRFASAARQAREEGQERAARALLRIAETEKMHARRFRQYLTALEEGVLFQSPQRTGWLCLACGCRHYGCEAPECCESCGCEQGHFIRGDFFPFAV